MAFPKIRTRVVHSETKPAWNVVGTELGSKYKIARVPYIQITNNPELAVREKWKLMNMPYLFRHVLM